MITKSYFGCRVIQRVDANTSPFFVFQARSKDIKQWVGIRRVEESKEGTQRLLRESRMKAITRFIKSESINTIPNSILLAFEPGKANFISLRDQISGCVPKLDIYNDCEKQIDWGILEFSFDPTAAEHLRPALIVDGQHRLYGVSNYEDEDLPIIVVSLLEASLQEQAFQFVVINNKSVRVPTENVKSIIANIDEDQLQIRLLKAGVRYGDKSPVLRDINDLNISPFQGLLDWAYNIKGQKLVNLAAIEQSLRYIQAAFAFLDEDEDSQLGIFFAVWMAVKANYPELWAQDNKFMTKVNINALNEFLIDRLKVAWEMGLVDVFDTDALERQVSNILKLLPKEFWDAEWSIKIQDNANVRQLIKKDLALVTENCRLKKPWNEDLKLPLVDVN